MKIHTEYEESLEKNLRKVAEANSEYFPEGFSLQDLLSDGNVIVEDGFDYGIFEKKADGQYLGHYFFQASRGRAALNKASAILKTMFNDVGAKVIIGLTPVWNKKASWVSRRLGFAFEEVVDTHHGPCEMVYLTKRDWELINGIS